MCPVLSLKLTLNRKMLEAAISVKKLWQQFSLKVKILIRYPTGRIVRIYEKQVAIPLLGLNNKLSVRF